MWRMAMGTRQSEQGSLWVATAELPKSLGHPFYMRLNALLDGADFDRFVEGQCARFYAPVMGRPSPLRRSTRTSSYVEAGDRPKKIEGYYEKRSHDGALHIVGRPIKGKHVLKGLKRDPNQKLEIAKDSDTGHMHGF
jgi:hypothetical protein